MPPWPSQAFAPVAVVVVPSLHAVFPDCAYATAGITAAMRAAAAVREMKRETDMRPSEGVAKLTRVASSASPPRATCAGSHSKQVARLHEERIVDPPRAREQIVAPPALGELARV